MALARVLSALPHLPRQPSPFMILSFLAPGASRGQPRHPNRLGDRALRIVGVLDALDLRPCAESDQRTADFEREADLAQRAALAGERDHRVGAADDDGIARLAQPGSDRELDVRIRSTVIVAWQDADGMCAALARAARRRFHHAAPPATDQGCAVRADFGPDLMREFEHFVAGAVAATDHRDCRTA